ncbi:acyl-CoA dehydrogenase C-terminal domain-containing protein [Pseudemcibacter aquimaris]|uniref:acyl-CoA dehydrogenase C-terminal domain-containing protein n=1 Tax=Pseudemcibacter aquimaris TaxID=2857064 RepID=UPI0020121756|nr:acyl-CoA dehydrogenase C-terminal domain-containing protein [Pseudemcibacter aquimaris]MCC3862020.1 acyl-CoA dehydrogenase C-terminal domain-containing protein [Pseudemcibacter aquimaris]WDU58772.1 acyl-CoA dehydrogenase C-terminal domain-containing protein [Pseudemcibacter aquimaris]
MPSYKAPVKDYQFLLHQVFNLSDYEHLKSFEESSPDLIDAILEEAAKLTENVFQPLNQSGDEEGCKLENGVVSTPKGFKDAYDQFTESGWQGICGDPEYGGQGLPMVLGQAINEMMVSSNWGLSMYPGLTNGAAETIHTWGTDEQKQAYLPKMTSGEWSGTMNLTEPHCGTDLGMLRTKAEPNDDGSYSISGTKIFISAGDHDLTENIIHLVLARITGAPDGTDGISLFIVPKFQVNDDGSLGNHNGVTCGSLEEKMGIHSNATCLLNYDNAKGYLLGEENKGMRAMFTMMNEARLGVGVQGLAIAEVAQQNAADYAKERIQGRALKGAKFPDQAADPIIVHPDVRRMLMTTRAFTEGARAIVVWAALQSDVARHEQDENKKALAYDLLSLMTPVIKSYLTDQGVDAASRSMQCLGGHGYITEWGMTQFLSDARIAPIYEGTNGIQAMDLVGRKLPRKNGEVIRAYFTMIQEFIDEHKGNEDLTEYCTLLEKALQRQQAATMWLMQNAMSDPDQAGATAHYYLNLMALVCMGFAWLNILIKAKAMIKADEGDKNYLKNKVITGNFFFHHILPETTSLRYKIEAGAGDVMAMEAEDF